MDNVQDAVNNAVEKQHLTSGDTVNANTAMHMMDDVFKELQKEAKSERGNGAKVSEAYMKDAAQKMETALAQFGVLDIVFDSDDKNDVAGKGDMISVKVNDKWGDNDTVKTFNLGERPAAQTRTEPTEPQYKIDPSKDPTWGNTRGETGKDPKDIKIPGY